MDDKRLAEIREACEDGDTLANLTEVYDMLGDVLVELDALRPDAKLGAAVRWIPQNCELCHENYIDNLRRKHTGWTISAIAGMMGTTKGRGKTPDAAMRDAGLMETDANAELKEGI